MYPVGDDDPRSEDYMAPVLKEFNVVKVSAKHGTLACPKKDCKGEFTVDRKQFKAQKPTFPTRPCPYCFKVSLIPGLSKPFPGRIPGTKGK
jgi:hypothetical protein